MFFKNNPAAAASLGLLLEAQKIGLRLSRGSKSYQTVKHGEEAEFKLMHEEDFYMLLKSDTEGNYSLQVSPLSLIGQYQNSATHSLTPLNEHQFKI